MEDQQERTDILSDLKKCVLLKPRGTICMTRVIKLFDTMMIELVPRQVISTEQWLLSTRCNSCKEAHPALMEANVHLPKLGLCHHAFWSLPCRMVPSHFSYVELHCLFMCSGAMQFAMGNLPLCSCGHPYS